MSMTDLMTDISEEDYRQFDQYEAERVARIDEIIAELAAVGVTPEEAAEKLRAIAARV